MQNKKILIIEDDNVLREMLTEKLTQHGYNTSVAGDGIVGMDKIKNEKPDLILLDILMPKKTGMEVLEELHVDDVLKTIPVIVISNSGQPVEIQRARELGAKEFLIKAAFSPSEILEKVKQVLQQETKDLFGDHSTRDNTITTRNDNENDGSTNVFELDEQHNNTEDTKNVSGSKKGEQRKMLIVEDDKFLRELFVRKMFKEGFDVQSAIDADQTFEILTTQKPEIILLDLILPGMDGFEILEKLKKDDSLKTIPVMVLSNLGQKEDINRAMKLGAVDFLIKANYTLDEIIVRVLVVLQKEG